MPVETISAIGFRLYLATASSEATMVMDAPSLRPEAFPAVTVPSFLKAGLSVARTSGVDFRLGNSSVSKIVSPFLPGTTTGTISSLKRPLSMAARAFFWDP